MAFAEALGANRSDLRSLCAISVVMAAVLLGSYAVPWHEFPARFAVSFAVVSVAAFFVLGLCTAATFAPVTGFLTLTMVYVGLTQPTRVAVTTIPFAGVALASNYTRITGAIVIRTIVAVSVWLVTVTALCWLTRTNRDTTAQLRASAFMDALTGLPNRRDLDVRLAGRLGDNEMIIVLDLDHFKRINDTLGHSAGDQVLRRFATLLREQLRSTTDYCARLGGEEFVVILGSAFPATHQAVLDRLRDHWHRVQPDVTFSSGSAPGRPDRSAHATLDAADAALYLAKNQGRNTDRSEDQLLVTEAAPIAVG